MTRPHLAVRLAWGAACLAVAGVAASVALDRGSRDSLALAGRVPEPFRGYAQASLVQQMLADGKDPKVTFAEAVELIRRRPLPAEHLTLFAQAAYKVGSAPLSDQAVMMAAGRGWRDILTQQAMVSAAMAGGQSDIAVSRLTALWNIGVPGDAIAKETVAVVSDPAARKGFAKQVAANGLWSDSFLTWGVANLPVVPYAETVSGAIDAGARFDCKRLSTVASMMVRAGVVGPAKAVWRGPCAGQSRKSGNAFELLPQAWGTEQGPFDWDYPQAAGLAVEFREEDGRSLVDYVNTDALSHVLARRYAEFPAGTYSLAAEGDLPSATSLILRVRCVAEGGIQGGVVRLALSRESASFNIPAEGCPAQLLELVVSRGKGTGLRLVSK